MFLGDVEVFLSSFADAVEENERLMEEVKTHSHRVHKELKSKCLASVYSAVVGIKLEAIAS